jgi:4-amino-4-deoxy-L-arabinose transferase-like glycosyltransferase
MDPVTLTIAHILAFATCLACVTYTSMVLIHALGIPSNISRLLALAILNCAQIVVVVEVLSLLESIRVRNLVLVHWGVAAILLAFQCRPAALLPYKPREFFQQILSGSDRPLQVLLLITTLAGATTFLLALYVPPNNHDSMTYHLARVGFYLQQRSLKSYPTANIRQTVFPANAEILMLWQVSLLKRDTAVALVQWLSWLGSVLAIYGIARRLRAPPKGALFAALAFASFPEIVLQSTSTQNDLVTAFFLLCAFLFVAELPRAPATSILLAGTSIGLAIGTKTLALAMLPGFGIYILACLIAHEGFTLRRVLGLVLLSLVGCLALGSYFYFQNLSNYGHVTGPVPFTKMHALDKFEWHVAWSNFGRSLMQFLNPNGIIPPWHPMRQFVSRSYLSLADGIFRHLGISRHLPGKDFFDISWTDYPALSMQEDFAVFGPIFGWLGLAVLFSQLLRPDHGRESVRLRALALAPIIFWLLVAAILRWQVWLGRFMVPMVAVSSPLFANLYSERKRRLSLIWNILLVGACISCLFSAVLLNEMKPLVGWRTLFNQDRIEMLTWGNASVEPLVRIVDRMGLGGLSLGLVAPNGDEYEYPFFGSRFERTIIPIRLHREELMDVRKLPRVDYVLFFAEAQYFLTEKSTVALNAVTRRADFRSLLAAIRAPGSGWYAVVDIDGVGHLFRREGLNFDPSILLGLPEFFPGPTRWDDRWVAREFTAHVRINPAKPNVFLRGEMPDLGMKPVLEVFGPDGTVLGQFALPGPGPFTLTFPLESLVSRYSNSYAAIRFSSNLSFNPKRLGQSNDNRDLSWRLLELKLTDATDSHSVLPDYHPTFTWYSDKWVQRRIIVPVRRDPAVPCLQIRGDMPLVTGRSDLKVSFEGTLLGEFRPSDSGIFTHTVSLKPMIARCKSEYCPIEFDSNTSFNPKKEGQSDDDRNLSWRLYALKLYCTDVAADLYRATSPN